MIQDSGCRIEETEGNVQWIRMEDITVMPGLLVHAKKAGNGTSRTCRKHERFDRYARIIVKMGVFCVVTLDTVPIIS